MGVAATLPELSEWTLRKLVFCFYRTNYNHLRVGRPDPLNVVGAVPIK